MKRTAAALALMFTVACSSTSMTSNESTNSGGATTKQVQSRYAKDFIALSTPGYVQEWNFGAGSAAGGFYVKGNMTKSGFVPEGEVLGKGTFCENGQDWLSLSELRVYSADKTPVAPYIRGCKSGNGFRPSSREIVR